MNEYIIHYYHHEFYIKLSRFILSTYLVGMLLQVILAPDELVIICAFEINLNSPVSAVQ